MTPPDRLVQAASEVLAMHLYPSSGPGAIDPRDFPVLAKAALAAAFAALPECEMEIRLPVGFGKSYADGWRDCLAALAREFGEPT